MRRVPYYTGWSVIASSSCVSILTIWYTSFADGPDTTEQGGRLAEAFLEKIIEEEDLPGQPTQTRIFSDRFSLDSFLYTPSVSSASAVADDTHTRIDEVPREESAPQRQAGPPSNTNSSTEKPPTSALIHETSERGKEAARPKSRLTRLLPLRFAERDSRAKKALRTLYSSSRADISSDDLSRTLHEFMRSFKRLHAPDFIGLTLHQPGTDDTYTIRQCIASGSNSWVFEAVTSDGRRSGKCWGLFTATGPLMRLLRRTGVPLLPLAPARPDRLSDAARWGRYYQTDPWVCALQDSVQPLRFMPRRSQHLTGARPE